MKTKKPTEKMLVKVEIYWGCRWTGSCYEPTPGVGIRVNVSEHYKNRREGFSFRGCPLGRTCERSFSSDEEAIEYAIADFIGYGKPEYLGKEVLRREMIEVVETNDYRTPVVKETVS